MQLFVFILIIASIQIGIFAIIRILNSSSTKNNSRI